MGKDIVEDSLHAMNQIRIHFNADADIVVGCLERLMPKVCGQDGQRAIDVHSIVYHLLQRTDGKGMAQVMDAWAVMIPTERYPSFGH